MGFPGTSWVVVHGEARLVDIQNSIEGVGEDVRWGQEYS